jgi:hypothetical protein
VRGDPAHGPVLIDPCEARRSRDDAARRPGQPGPGATDGMRARTAGRRANDSSRIFTFGLRPPLGTVGASTHEGGRLWMRRERGGHATGPVRRGTHATGSGGSPGSWGSTTGPGTRPHPLRPAPGAPRPRERDVNDQGVSRRDPGPARPRRRRALLARGPDSTHSCSRKTTMRNLLPSPARCSPWHLGSPLASFCSRETSRGRCPTCGTPPSPDCCQGPCPRRFSRRTLCPSRPWSNSGRTSFTTTLCQTPQATPAPFAKSRRPTTRCPDRGSTRATARSRGSVPVGSDVSGPKRTPMPR